LIDWQIERKMKDDIIPEIEICDVALRDGIQNISNFVDTETKISLLNLLVKSGIKEIEVTSFVHPKAIAQFADAESILKCALKQKGVLIKTLVPNLKGASRALDAGSQYLVFVFSASEVHNKNNVNMTINQSIEQLQAITELIRHRPEIKIQLNLATTFGYHGDSVSLEKIETLTAEVVRCGVKRVMYCDTSGVAVPTNVVSLINRIRSQIPQLTFGFHFHDTFGTAIANCVKALECGSYIFESSVGGLGGCPFAVKASGNVATEDLIWVMEKMGVKTGIELDLLLEASHFIKDRILFDKPIDSRLFYAKADK
jgi:hydroxymethylglutaryl-CoA lyase